MIFNAATQGGIRKEDINAELLQTLDPDFIADNIAEGVDLFGLVGTRPAGAKIAKGTATVSNNTITVSGLGFTPTNVYLLRNSTKGNYMLYAINATGYGFDSSSQATTITLSLSKTNGGFKASYSGSYCKPNGTYYWVAWS